MNNKYDLNNKWVLWCHSINNNNWDEESYNKIYEIENLYDYYSFKDNIKKNNYFDSMFFLMRDGILPIWEDKNNVNGCCLTIKIPSKDVKTEWDKLVLKCISENIHINIDKYIINKIIFLDFNSLNDILLADDDIFEKNDISKESITYIKNKIQEELYVLNLDI